MKEIFYKLNPWWEGEFHTTSIPRLKYTSDLNRLLELRDIILITGLRRVGKTTIMKQVIEQLLQKTAPPFIFYVSLDAYGLEKYSIHDIVTEFRKTHRLGLDQKVYVFLDEIGAKEDFHRELKDFYDHENMKIFASASSTSILRDRKAYLTGRSRTIEILPLDFDEFLEFRKIKIKTADSYLLENYFLEYMQSGGLPEYVITQDITYLSELIDSIIYKDIIAFHNIKDNALVKDFFRLLMERAGKIITLNKVAKILGISLDTVRRFMEYFRETYLIYTIKRCGKLNQRLRSGQKLYAGDVGLKNLVTGFRDKGAVFENMVYLKIKQHSPCFIYENGIELDFFFKGHLIEAKYGQELKGKQLRLFENFPAKERLIISSWKDFVNLDNLLAVKNS
ncbi:MAG: ATP-binding protein [candidate division KSB1 bacterium]|nr:ATP-binding protein [candidate division KSB1 bacterium]